MKGQNKLDLCEAELIRVVETYLNEHLLKQPVKVQSIKAENHSFIILLEGEE